MTETEHAPENGIDDRSATLIREGLSFAAGLFADPSADMPAPDANRGADPDGARQGPVLAWLAHLLRPSTAAGLQLRRAGAHFALCAAFVRLGLEARAWGFGSWSGEDDPAAPNLPSSALPPALRARNARDFGQISRLARMSGAGAALARFEPGMFDLILIDAAAPDSAAPGSAAPESAGPDPQDLAERLAGASAPGGVVVVQGLDDREAAGRAAAQALVRALAERHPVLPFAGNGGLALVLTGSRPAPALAALTRAGAAGDLAALQARLADLAGPRPAETQSEVQTGAEAGAGAEAESPPAPGMQEAPDAAAPETPPDTPSDTPRETPSGTPLAAPPEAACEAVPELAPEVVPEAPAATDPATNPGADLRLAALQAELDAARARLAEGHALRLRETRVLTAELERLTEVLRAEKAEAEAGLRAAAETAAATEAARAEAAAELAALRIRLFDEGEALRGEIAWLERTAAETLAEAQAGAEARLAAETARAAAAAAEAAAAHAAERAAERAADQARLAAQVAAGRKTATRLQQQVDRLRAEAADRERMRQVQIGLRDWQLAWVTGKPRLGKRTGPSGGSFAEELAAVERSPLFDAGWYRSAHPDLQDSPLSPAEHFLRHGLFEGRNPGPGFRTLAWFAENPGALADRRNPLLDPAQG